MGLAASHLPSSFLTEFDPHKPRVFKPKQRVEPLKPELHIDDILSDLGYGKFKNVVVLSGAGMSVSAGIPAFRTAGGLYDQTSAFNEDDSTRHSNLFRP